MVEEKPAEQSAGGQAEVKTIVESSEAKPHNEIPEFDMDDKDVARQTIQSSQPKQSIPSQIMPASQAQVKGPPETQLVPP